MKKYSVLTLTDHSGHSDQNSIYSILNSMVRHNKCDFVDVASRGIEANNAFFYEGDLGQVYAMRVDDEFDFNSSQSRLQSLSVSVDPTQYDVIFMRLPRPVSDEFLASLSNHFVEQTFINDPLGIVTCSNKSFLLNFKSVCPPMELLYSIDDIIKFSRKFDIVLKPLKEYGGKGIIKISGDTVDDGFGQWPVMDFLKGIEEQIMRDGYLAMKFLKNVDQGDKRLIVVDGEILASSLRLPAEGSWLCNVAQGGRSVRAEATRREEDIVETIAPILKDKGIVIYGVDTLVDDNGERVLSEINALSIGGFPQAQEQTGKPIINMLLDNFFNYIEKQRNNDT